MKKYFYTDGSSKFGPYSLEELLERNISRDTKIWFYGLASWKPISQVEELNEFLERIPPPMMQPPPLPVSEPPKLEPPKVEGFDGNSNSKWVNIAVAIFILALITLAIWVAAGDKEEITSSEEYEMILESAYDSDEDFSLYMDKFYRDLNVYGLYPKKPTEVIIKFARLDQITNSTHVHAYSFGGQNDDSIEIYINPSSWEKFNKPKRYFLMYHELAHDVLNLDDLPVDDANKGKLMYPIIESYERLTMDEFIESYQELFESLASNQSEKYINDLYNELGAEKRFGNFESFRNLISVDEKYASEIYYEFGGESVFGKYSDFLKLLGLENKEHGNDSFDNSFNRISEQAIQDAYNFFVENGYKKSIDDFKVLISNNPQALSDAYFLFVQNGYSGSKTEFEILMGLKIQK